MSRFTTYRMKGSVRCQKKTYSSVATVGRSYTTKHSRVISALIAQRSAVGAKKVSKTRTTEPNRIGSHWKRKPDVIVYRDGRERCNPGTPGGRGEYINRKSEMYIRQDALCCVCCKPLAYEDMTFEHEHGRTAGRIDERIEVNGKPRNGVSHLVCNSARGSRKTRIYHYPQLERRRA